MRTDIIATILVFLALAGVLYLFFSFMAWSFDPIEWGLPMRIVFSVGVATLAWLCDKARKK